MRSNVSSSQLVSLLSDLAQVDTEVSRQDWAEQLGMWFGPVDAIRLSAVHQAIKVAAAQPTRPSPLSRSSQQTRPMRLDDAFRQLRIGLADELRDKFPHASVTTGPESAPEFAPYRQWYLALQRRMEWKLDPFRDHCRQVLSQTSTRLRQLADLDAVLEPMLGAREKALLSKVPALLERRFAHLKQSPAEDWLGHFAQDGQALMLAELNFRLEPIAGLVEAWNNAS